MRRRYLSKQDTYSDKFWTVARRRSNPLGVGRGLVIYISLLGFYGPRSFI
jgi:hypothetical protein